MKVGWSMLALGAACIACCAPLLIAGASGLGIVVGAWSGRMVLLIVAAVLAVAAAGVFVLRRVDSRRQGCGCASQCEIGKCDQS